MVDGGPPGMARLDMEVLAVKDVLGGSHYVGVEVVAPLEPSRPYRKIHGSTGGLGGSELSQLPHKVVPIAIVLIFAGVAVLVVTGPRTTLLDLDLSAISIHLGQVHLGHGNGGSVDHLGEWICVGNGAGE